VQVFSEPTAIGVDPLTRASVLISFSHANTSLKNSPNSSSNISRFIVLQSDSILLFLDFSNELRSEIALYLAERIF